MFSAQDDNLVLSLDEERIHLGCVFKEYTPGWCQRDVCARSVKQLNANILLQRLDLEAHSGLREIQFFGGLSEAELFRNCPEDHKTEVFKTRHSMIKTQAHDGQCKHRSAPGQNLCEMSDVGHGGFGYSKLDLDLRRRQKRVVNQAVMHGAHEALRLFFRERDGARNMHAEVANADRLLQLFGGHCYLNACLREIASLQKLHGIKGRARSQRREQ
jgi:hypothetical protein